MNIQNLKNKNNSHAGGFTLVETLVAIFILLISTTGPLSFAQSGLRASFLARDQITAFYLAQDSIETIKNLRDKAHLDNEADWLSELGNCNPPNSDTVHCNIGRTVVSQACGSGTCPALWYDTDDYQFVVSNAAGNSLSKYTRTVYVSEIELNQEIQVVVVVSWDLARKSIVVQENIYKKY